MAESRRHILVVDDDEGMRELLVRYLSDNGYEVSGVADGLSMKRHLAAHQVDLIPVSYTHLTLPTNREV